MRECPHTVRFTEVPLAGPGFSGEVPVPPLKVSTNVASGFLAEVKESEPKWKKEVEAELQKLEQVKGFRQSRRTEEGKKKQRQVRGASS